MHQVRRSNCCFPASNDAKSGRGRNCKWAANSAGAVTGLGAAGGMPFQGGGEQNAELPHGTQNFVRGLLISTADSFTLRLFLPPATQRDSTWRRDHSGRRVPVDAAFLRWPRHASVHLNILHPDVRSALIPAVQPGPDSTALSAQPSHLLSITPQTNWTVTPLSGPRLHFSSHPSLPKTLFLLHCDIFDSPLPRICAASLGSTPSSLFGQPSLPPLCQSAFIPWD